MAKKIPITLACGDYEIIRALKDGAVKPDGIDLITPEELFLSVSQGRKRGTEFRI